ncbi:amidohydrolase [Qingshengfaniella alkalisoli]|uniref:Amidohydrolase n=1 Tax=Qingshengfaniella alkalisoli TaxID=2599296 RepID=A0A5B8J8W2_9RHOB|nr:amidohydrolase [Qingshengfaniella alkalisoli]QDY70797.1 amidohydrolase [Qingshengfaniella alkalisoli]
MNADIVILNGKLVTFDEEKPDAQAIAITGNKITAVGDNTTIRDMAGPQTKVIDAGGNTVLPGFIEGHVHVFQGSVELDRLNLHGVHGFDRLAQAVRRRAKERPDEDVILAHAADYHILGPGMSATRQDLDRIIEDRAFAMMASDHHTAWANTRALEMAGILHEGEAPEGSEIIRDAKGVATGMLVEPGAYGFVTALTTSGGRDAKGIVDGRSPDATPAQRTADMDVIAKGMEHCASHGITTMHNMDGNLYTLELLQGLDDRGELLCRTESPLHLKNTDPLDRIDDALEWRKRFNSDRVWCNRVKMFMDGVIESYTALMLQPYPDRPDTCGEELFSPEHFNAACIRADGHGFQIAVHAIGDRAVRQTLDGYEAAQKANGRRDSRHRVEHIEVIDPADLPRFKEIGVIASMQPVHSPAAGFFGPPEDGHILREDQLPYAFAWAKVRGAGALLTFSTDWPVVPVDVMPSIKGAVAPVDLGPGWGQNAQSLMDTLASYTRDSAFMEFNEDRKGRLKRGLLADIVVMDSDLFAMDPAELDHARATTTICDGRVTYQR